MQLWNNVQASGKLPPVHNGINKNIKSHSNFIPGISLRLVLCNRLPITSYLGWGEILKIIFGIIEVRD